MDIALIVAGIAFIGTLLGYVITYHNNVRFEQRRQLVDRVGRQLADLYGPMLAIVSANDRNYSEFLDHYSPAGEGNLWEEGGPIDPDELREWREWVTLVAMPGHRRLHELLLRHSDLLVETVMNESLIQFCSHVAAWELRLRRWEAEDFNYNLPIAAYPANALKDYAEASYAALKNDQMRLLGQLD